MIAVEFRGIWTPRAMLAGNSVQTMLDPRQQTCPVCCAYR